MELRGFTQNYRTFVLACMVVEKQGLEACPETPNILQLRNIPSIIVGSRIQYDFREDSLIKGFWSLWVPSEVDDAAGQ